jgi:hypothetical protein
MADLNPYHEYGLKLPQDVSEAWQNSRLIGEEATHQGQRNTILRQVMPLIAKGIQQDAAGSSNNRYKNTSPLVDDENSAVAIPGVNKDNIPSGAQPTANQPAPTLAAGGGARAAGFDGMVQASQNDTSKIQATSAGAGDKKSKVTAAIKAHVVDALAPLPEDMPENDRQAGLVNALTLSGEPDLMASAKGLKENFTTQAKSENERRIKEGNRSYSLADDVRGVPADKAWAIMFQQAPNEAKKIKAAHPGMSGEELQSYMGDLASAVHPFSGRGLELRNDGFVVDKPTGKRIPGMDHRVMWSPEEELKFTSDWDAPIVQTTDENNKQVMHSKHQLSGKTARQMMDAAAASVASGESSSIESYVDKQLPPEARGQIPRPPVSAIASTGSNVNSTSKGTPSLNSPNGKLDFSDKDKWTPAPRSYSGVGINVGAGPDETADATDQRLKVRAIDVQKGQDLAQDMTAITREQAVLRDLDKIRSGPAAEIVTVGQNLAYELLGNRAGTFFKQIAGSDPVAMNKINKFLNADATENIVHSADQTRVSAALYEFGKTISANITQNPEAIRELVKYAMAFHSYGVQMNGKDYSSAKKAGVDPINYDRNYLSNNQTSLMIPRYIRSIQADGSIDTSKGSPLNPYTPKNKEDVDSVPEGKWITRHDTGDLVQKPHSKKSKASPVPAQVPYVFKEDNTHGLISR